jgi:nucleoside 2-deoxyribosyltransferase
VSEPGSRAPAPVYLAGPDVFLPDSAAIGRQKQAICARHGLVGLSPGEGIDLDALPQSEHARALFEGCVAMMDRCVAGLANLTPFRGPSADVGTAFEMGYLFGRGFPVFGYTAHVDDYATRVDDEAHLVEAFGLADNLMLEGPMLRRELTIVRAAEMGPSPVAALTAFARTVRIAAAELGTEQP